MSCTAHPELFPTTCTPEQFTRFWNAHKAVLLKIHTRKLNHKFHIVDSQGREYKLIVRRGQAHLIPKLRKAMTNAELESELDSLKRLDKEFEFIDNRLRAIEGSFHRVLEKLELPPIEDDLKLVEESLFTEEQKDNQEKEEKRAAQKSEQQKLKVLAKTNAELEAAGITPLKRFADRNGIKLERS